MMSVLKFRVEGGSPFEVQPSKLVVAGWTGRDTAAVEHHIEELAAIGVPRPSSVPLYYRLTRSLLTQVHALEMLGTASSGEAEPVLVRHGGRWWLTVGSDHTDRSAEVHSVAVSKQMCAKPLASAAWAWDEVAARADTIVLRSEIYEGEHWVTYQQGLLSALRPLQSLIAGLPADLPVAEGLVLFCGTLAAIPRKDGVAIRPAERMRVELLDGERHIKHEYSVKSLPMVA